MTELEFRRQPAFRSSKQKQTKRKVVMKNIKAVLYVQTIAMLMTAALPNSVAAAGDVPFKGNLQGSFTIAPLTPPEALVVIEGTGNAAHLGRFTVEAPHVVSFATGSASGIYVFTAANGDTLTADFTGVAAPTANPGELLVVEIGDITGGTGRFEGATGNFTVVRLANLTGPTTGITTGSFDGTIVLGKAK